MKPANLQKKFKELFGTGCEMWTSEDGSLMSIAIQVRPDWKEVIQREHPSVFRHEKFDEAQGKPAFVSYQWQGGDYFDGPGCGQKRRGKVWMVTDDETSCPIINYELKIPR